MQKIGVLVDNKELELLMQPMELGAWLNQRRLELAGPRMADLAAMMEITRPQASELCSGRIAFGKRQIARLNAIDPAFEVVQMIAVVRKKVGKGKHGPL